jgi:hypothetical protein
MRAAYRVAKSVREAAHHSSAAPARCSAARIRSVEKKRSATMPTKNGDTIAAIAIEPYASPICSPGRRRVWPR